MHAELARRLFDAHVCLALVFHDGEVKSHFAGGHVDCFVHVFILADWRDSANGFLRYGENSSAVFEPLKNVPHLVEFLSENPSHNRFPFGAGDFARVEGVELGAVFGGGDDGVHGVGFLICLYISTPH